jgi:hypothetical protein
LRHALTILFKTVHPAGAAHAKAIADEVLTHELISDSATSAVFNKIRILKNYRLASAVRVEELIGILSRLAPGPANDPHSGGDNAGDPKAAVIRELANRARESVGPQIAAVARQAAKIVDAVEGAAPQADPNAPGTRAWRLPLA